MPIGADTAPINVTPSPDSQLSNPVHQIALVVNGISSSRTSGSTSSPPSARMSSALMVQPLKLVGATGSTVAPIAVR